MPRPRLASRPQWTARRVRASGSSVILAIVTIVGVIVARNVFLAARQPIGWVVAAAVTALVLWPIIERLDQWLPRAIGIILTLLISAAAVVGMWLAVSNEIQGQLTQLQERLPAAAEELEERGGEDGVLAQLRFGSLVDDLVDQTSERVAPEPTLEDAAGTAPAFLVSGILVIFFLVWGPSMLDGAQKQISDPDLREDVGLIAARSAWLTQRYVITAAALGIAAGVTAGVLAWWADLPTPLVLGVVLGVASVIPYVGILFGAIPLLLLAVASQSDAEAVGLALAAVALQAAYTTVLRRLSQRGVLRAGPAAIVVAALVGSDLYGLGGALVMVVMGIFAVAVIESLSEETADPSPATAAPEPA
ncbi:AI-2E family transporter [Aquihabitans daechungensis]|uniref:AI-2E family transporter n=1 Tax=Aquihabitans daechungensis TaxID=1052257 RepID=UPI003BA19E33